MSTATKKDVVIEWTVLEHGMIKFKDGTDTVYEVSDKVKTFIESQPQFLNGTELKEDLKASVEIDETKGDNGCVENIVLSEGTAPKTETTPEATTAEPVKAEVSGDTQRMQVKGVSVQKSCLTFYETPDQWFNLDDGLDVNKVKEMQKQYVNVVIEKNTGKGYDFVRSITLATDQPVAQPKTEAKNDFKPSTNKDSSVQRSIECQAAVNSACQVASRICIDQDSKDIQAFISEIAKNNYKLIQELKNS